MDDTPLEARLLRLEERVSALEENLVSMPRSVPPDLHERFFSNVKKLPEDEGSCWLWVGGGKQLRIGLKLVLATHISWVLHYGMWPTKNFMVKRRRDCSKGSRCVNPDHLYLWRRA